jgi:ABC-type transport system involved in multi-copper enzyme maturation permease subunit
VNGALTIVGYAVQEARRRRIFLIVLLLTLAFLALYGLGVDQVIEVARGDVAGGVPLAVDVRMVVGATLLGLAMFATFFLGTVLAVFLTLGVVRGDAERGLLQPLVVRPVGRSTVLLSRFAGAAVFCALYVLGVFGAAYAITGWLTGWWPDRFLAPALELVAAVALLAALSLLGSVFLSATANGIAVFMVFGAGLMAGFIGQIGEALGSETLREVALVASWALPFEALYQDALARLTIESSGLERFFVQLGPFGGAEAHGPQLFLWAAAYLVVVGAAALFAFARRDL